MNGDNRYQRKLLIEKFDPNVVHLNLTTIEVSAKPRKLRVKWTLEMFEDFNKI